SLRGIQSGFSVLLQIPGRRLSGLVCCGTPRSNLIAILCRPGGADLLPGLVRTGGVHRRAEDEGNRYPESFGIYDVFDRATLIGRIHENGSGVDSHRTSSQLLCGQPLAGRLCLSSGTRMVAVCGSWPRGVAYCLVDGRLAYDEGGEGKSGGVPEERMMS